MNYQAFDQFEFNENDDDNEEEQEILSENSEIEEKSGKTFQKDPIGYYTHSFKPSVKKTILMTDDFIPMARVKSEKEKKQKSGDGHGKKTKKNQ